MWERSGVFEVDEAVFAASDGTVDVAWSDVEVAVFLSDKSVGAEEETEFNIKTILFRLNEHASLSTIIFKVINRAVKLGVLPERLFGNVCV